MVFTRKKICFILFVSILLLVILIVLLTNNKSNAPISITKSPTQKPTIMSPPTPSINIPTSKPIIRPPFNNAKTCEYYKNTYKINNCPKSINLRLSQSFATTANNPYFLSQIDMNAPYITMSTSTQTSTMDFIQPESGFPIGMVTINHDPPFDPYSPMHLLECVVEYPDKPSFGMTKNFESRIREMSRGMVDVFTSYRKVFNPVSVHIDNRDVSFKLCSEMTNQLKPTITITLPNGGLHHDRYQSGGKSGCYINNAGYNALVTHECGHGLGLPHSAGVYPNSRVKRNNFSDYNSLNDYGSNVCGMAHERSVFQPPVIFKLGWYNTGFLYIEHGMTYTLASAEIMHKTLPTSIVMIDPYTGSKVFHSYHTYSYSSMANKHQRPDNIFKNSEIFTESGFVAVVTNHVAKKTYQVGYWSKLTYTTPYGWTFNVIKADSKSITFTTTYNTADNKYLSSIIDFRIKSKTGSKTVVEFILHDTSPESPRDNWPRMYDSSMTRVVDNNGNIFQCTTSIGRVSGLISVESGNKIIYTCTIANGAAYYIFTLNIATHAMTKKFKI